MTVAHPSSEVDGRTARRDRNRIAVLDAVLELFSEDDLDPSPEQVARRSGVSLRSVYRYVANGDELVRAAIERHLENVRPLFVIHDVGLGPLDERIETLVATRLRVHEAIAPTARASRLRAPTNAIIGGQLEAGRRAQREQVEQQLAPELDALGALDPERRRAVAAAADALLQIETIDLYRVHRRCSSSQTHRLLVGALRSLLGADA